jgi:nucleoside-diphosphate-sugar epimerase
MAQTILITGAGGYVGTMLVDRLLSRGYAVRALDTFWFGDYLPQHPQLEKIRGDMRNRDVVARSVKGVDAVVHLACLSNDPMSELDTELTKAINFTACRDVVVQAKAAGVRRFLYASSASVYGVREEPEIAEDMTLEPITLYSQFKADIEHELFSIGDRSFTTMAVRNSTVCGYSPRMRLDLIVNIFVMAAMERGEISIEGGTQLRPLIYMGDLLDFYCLALEIEAGKIHQQAFNVSSDNYKVVDVAKMVQALIPCRLQFKDWTDPRSYHVSTAKAERELGYRARTPITASIEEVKAQFAAGAIDSSDHRCYNVKHLRWLMEQSGTTLTVA